MYQPLIKFHPYPAIITQVLRIFVNKPYQPCNHENNRHFIVSFILPAHACKENG